MIHITVNHNSDDVSVTNDKGKEIIYHKMNGSASRIEEFLEQLLNAIYGEEPDDKVQDHVALYRLDEDRHKEVASWSAEPIKD